MSRPVPFPAVAAAAYAALAAQSVHPVLPESGAGAHLCPFFLLTGHRCPGCGMGHALIAAFRGDWAASWASHPLGIPLLALWTAWLAWGAFNLARGRRFSDGASSLLAGPALTWSALAAVLLVHAVRSV